MKHTLSVTLRAALAITLLVGICGCWSAEELNNRAFVMMMLIDEAEDGQTELTLSFTLPNRMIPGQAGGGGGGGGTADKPYTFVTKKAKTISEAWELIKDDNSRRISFGQTRIVVIGRKYAEKGLDPLLEFAARQPAFHLSSNLFVTPNKAIEIANAPTVFERFISEILLKFISQHLTLDTTIKDLMMARYKGGDILLPLLSFTLKPEIGSGESKKHAWMGTDGAAIIREGKMSKIRMNSEQLRGSLWISSQLESSIISVDSPTDGKTVNAIAQGIGTKISPVIKDGKISFKIRSSATSYIVASDSDIDLKNDEMLQKLQEAFQKKIESRLKEVIAKTKEARSDAFLMNQYLYWRYPKVWNRIKTDWRDYYADEMPVDVSVKIIIKRTGGIIRSVTQEELIKGQNRR